MSEKQPESKIDHNSSEVNPLTDVIEAYDQYIKNVDSQLGDFNPWDTPEDDPRWNIVNTLPAADLSYLNATKRDAQERAATQSNVNYLQTVPKDKRGGAWDFVSTDMMNMNADPLELTNPDAARQFRMDRVSKDIEKSLENQKPRASRVASAVMSRLIRK